MKEPEEKIRFDDPLSGPPRGWDGEAWRGAEGEPRGAEREPRSSDREAREGARGRTRDFPFDSLDLSPVFALIDALRRPLPRELEEQLTNLLREFLLTLRALIDWYLERLDRRSREPEVEEIPID
jgi:hypothetical protein